MNNEAPLSCPYYNDRHVENITTGVNTYEFTIPANHETSEAIESNGYVLFRDLDDRFQMFQIKEIDEFSNLTDKTYEKTIYCEHIAIPELLGNPLRPASLNSYTAENALLYVLEGTGWTLGDMEYTDSKDYVIEDYTNCLEGLKSILELYEVEVQYEIVFQNGNVTKRLIHVHKEIGTKTMKRFSYSKDLMDVRRTENSENVVTALIGVGKGDSGGSRVTLNNYTEPVPSGYEKPSEVDWIGNNNALQIYGKNGKHIFGVYMSEASTKQAVFDETLKELKIRSKPEMKYEMKVVTLERIVGYEADKVRVGDTIVGDDYTFVPRLEVEARVLELTRSYTNPEDDAIVLGDYRPIKINHYDSIDKIQNLISKAEEKWNATSYKVEILSSDGLMFRNGTISTVLEARIYRGGVDITSTVDANYFQWTRKSNYPDADTAWNNTWAGGRKTINITGQDVNHRATFQCEVNLP